MTVTAFAPASTAASANFRLGLGGTTSIGVVIYPRVVDQDAIDLAMASRTLMEIDADPSLVVRGAELEAELTLLRA